MQIVNGFCSPRDRRLLLGQLPANRVAKQLTDRFHGAALSARCDARNPKPLIEMYSKWSDRRPLLELGPIQSNPNTRQANSPRLANSEEQMSRIQGTS